jgi:hypothetical protein
MEQFDQAGLVVLSQTGQSSRSAGPPKSNVATLLMLLPPSANRLIAYLQSTPDLAIVEVFVEQLHGLEPALFQCHEIPFNASRIAHTGLDALKTK